MSSYRYEKPVSGPLGATTAHVHAQPHVIDPRICPSRTATFSPTQQHLLSQQDGLPSNLMSPTSIQHPLGMALQEEQVQDVATSPTHDATSNLIFDMPSPSMSASPKCTPLHFVCTDTMPNSPSCNPSNEFFFSPHHDDDVGADVAVDGMANSAQGAVPTRPSPSALVFGSKSKRWLQGIMLLLICVAVIVAVMMFVTNRNSNNNNNHMSSVVPTDTDTSNINSHLVMPDNSIINNTASTGTGSGTSTDTSSTAPIQQHDTNTSTSLTNQPPTPQSPTTPTPTTQTPTTQSPITGTPTTQSPTTQTPTTLTPTTSIPTTLAPLGAPVPTYPPISSLTSNRIMYTGGQVMYNPITLYYIFYGTWPDTHPALKILPQFLIDLTTTPNGTAYWSTATTYYSYSPTTGITRRTSSTIAYGGHTVISPYGRFVNITTLTDSHLYIIINDTISNGWIPNHGKNVNPDAIYNFILSSDLHQGYFCDQYCGFHTRFLNITYTFIGDATGSAACISACTSPPNRSKSPNGHIGSDSMISMIAHEIVEAATAPNNDGWKNSYQENADLCAYKYGSTYVSTNGARANVNMGGRDYLLQQNWVNRDGGYCGLRDLNASIPMQFPSRPS